MIKILWVSIYEGFMMLLGKAVNLEPCTAKQHCVVHPAIAYALYERLVQVQVPMSFLYPISSSLVLRELLLRRI